MIWSLIFQIVRLVLDLLMLHNSVDKAKDLELLVLRQQIRILERRVGKPVRPSLIEKSLLTLAATQLKEQAWEGQKRFNENILLFKPDKILKYHRELVKRKWAIQQRVKVGQQANLYVICIYSGGRRSAYRLWPCF